MDITGENAATQKKADVQRIDFNQQFYINNQFRLLVLFVHVQVLLWRLRAALFLKAPSAQAAAVPTLQAGVPPRLPAGSRSE